MYLLSAAVDFVATHYTLISLGLAAGGLMFTVYQNTAVRRRQYALDMIRGWNEQTAADKALVERKLKDITEACSGNRVKECDVRATIESDPDVKAAVNRLFNYFEFVASAYLHRAASRKVIRESFAPVILRLYCVLGEYIAWQISTTGRNPWPPLSRFVEIIASEGPTRANRSAPCCLTLCDAGTDSPALACRRSKTNLVFPDLPLAHLRSTRPGVSGGKAAVAS